MKKQVRSRHRALLERIARLQTNLMLKLLTQGRRAYDDRGFPLVDQNGNPVYKAPTAADHRAIMAWLKYNRIRVDDTEHRNELAKLADRAREMGAGMLGNVPAAEDSPGTLHLRFPDEMASG